MPIDTIWRNYRFHLRLLVYGVFVAVTLLLYSGVGGDDLSSSYFGCRLLSEGEASHLYDFDPVYFHKIGSAVWVSEARHENFNPEGLHPYVQTPLWAWALEPLCTRMHFGAFRTLFNAVALGCLALLVELTLRRWARKFESPWVLAVLLAALLPTQPLHYAVWLAQTHAIFLALAIAALVAADARKPAWAGGLLAVAAAVKITPGIFLLYWIAKRQYRAAAWFVFISAALLVATVSVAGPGLFAAYLQSMQRVGEILLVTYNNQSFAAWWAYSDALAPERQAFHIAAIGHGLKYFCLAATLLVAYAAGRADARRSSGGAMAILVLVAATVLTPIAWTHYYLVLIPAAMVLVQRGGLLCGSILAAVYLLNIEPLANNPLMPAFGPHSILMSHFYSGMLAMAALAACGLLAWRDAGARGQGSASR